jgi:hypothetical protein
MSDEPRTEEPTIDVRPPVDPTTPDGSRQALVDALAALLVEQCTVSVLPSAPRMTNGEVPRCE